MGVSWVFLGIDIGTSSVKALLVDENEKVVAQASAPLTVDRPKPLFSEQAPEVWWQATVSAIGDLPADSRRAVRAIGLSGQMHGATLLDKFGLCGLFSHAVAHSDQLRHHLLAVHEVLCATEADKRGIFHY